MSNWLNIRNEGETAEIDITGVIGGGFLDDGVDSEQLRNELKAIEALDVKKIIVNIESPGGYVRHALAIHDLLAQSKAKIEVRVNGMTASAATVIAMAGDEIKMSDNALFLVHRVTGLSIGNGDTMRGDAKNSDKVENRLVNIYKKRTGKHENTIKTLMARNNGEGEWLTPQEAMDYGFVDKIFEPMKMAATVSEEVLNKLRLPGIPKNNFENKNENMSKSNESFMDSIVNAIREGFKGTSEKAEAGKDKEAIVAEISKKSEEITASLEEQLKNAVDTVKKEYEKELTALKEKASSDKETIATLEAKVAGKEVPPKTDTEKNIEEDEEGKSKNELFENLVNIIKQK